MKILNIGIPELIFILIIALIVLGPNGIVKTARNLGIFIRKVIRSPIWAMMLDTQRELREMPTKLVREAGLEEELADLRKTSREVQQATRDLNQSNPIFPPVRTPPPLNLPIGNRPTIVGNPAEITTPQNIDHEEITGETEATPQENRPDSDPAAPENNQ